MEQRLTLITLGVKNLDVSRKFYEGLGWKVVEKNSSDSVVFFQLGTTAISLFSGDHLSEWQQKSVTPVPGGITLGYNTRSKQEAAC